MRPRFLTALAASAAVALVLAGAGCGTAHTARPLGKGHTSINVGLGGPIADLGGATVPAPMPTIAVKHGITDRHDLFAQWQVLPAALGAAAIDLGGSWYFADQRKGAPGLSTAWTLHTLWNRADAWIAVDGNLVASWELHPRHLLYLGFHLTFTPIEPIDMDLPKVHLTPLLGGELRLGKQRRFGLGLELKWADPWADTDSMIVDYGGSKGALSVTGGFNFYLGDGSQRRARQQAADATGGGR